MQIDRADQAHAKEPYIKEIDFVVVEISGVENWSWENQNLILVSDLHMLTVRRRIGVGLGRQRDILSI